MKKKDKEQLNILLGITGCIAAYKACELIRLFTRSGHNVKVALSRNGAEFITPLTLETLSENRIYCDLFDRESFSTEHISLSKWADVMLVAPATANIIGKFAAGIADDIISTLYLSFKGPVLVAPAMHTEMLKHPAVESNLEIIKSYGVAVIEPEKGELASGDWGEGRFPGVKKIRDAVLSTLSKKKDLKGKKILITAGPTKEYLDPVRYISSPSSGKMGIALAKEAENRGAKVTLIHGPISLDPDISGKVIAVNTAEEMERAVFKNSDCNIFISSAAVSDFAPRKRSSQKIKKNDSSLNIELEPTTDILKKFSQEKGKKKIIVGFAAESNDITKNAILKSKDKKLDLIVANDISLKESGFGSNMNRATIIRKNGKKEKLPLMSKNALAGIIFDRIRGITKR